MSFELLIFQNFNTLLRPVLKITFACSFSIQAFTLKNVKAKQKQNNYKKTETDGMSACHIARFCSVGIYWKI